jgi:hypothetical protein
MIPRLMLTALLALLLPCQVLPEIARPDGAKGPAALHVSSYGSMRAARLGADGSIDAGDAVLVLVDGETGAPLVPKDLRLAEGLQASAEFKSTLGPLKAEAHLIAMPAERGGDERVKAVLRVVVINKAKEGGSTAKVSLAASLRAGGGEAADRPFPSVPFDAAATWAQDGSWITRDGRGAFWFAGTDAEVKLNPHVAAPGDEIARLTWTFEVPVNNARLFELALAGPPAGSKVDEPAFRQAFERWTFMTLEEQLSWQTRFRGDFADIQFGDPRMWYAAVGPVQYLRQLGVADKEPRAFSDRPFGHPASDAGVDAEALAVFSEWGFLEWDSSFAKSLLAQAVERGEALPPARRVAMLHGLARHVRLGLDSEDHATLVAAMARLLDASTQGAEVRPWLDPDRVRADFEAVLEQSPAPEGWELPRFAWCSAPKGPVATEFVAIRRALSAHDGETVWQHMAPLVAATSPDGLGAMTPGAVPDGEYALGFPSLLREMWIDDHGIDLHLFPATPKALIPERGHGALEIPNLPTRYGRVELSQHYQGKKGYGVTVLRRSVLPGGDVLLHLPKGLQAEELISPAGGSVVLREDGLVLCDADPSSPKGLRFNVRLAGGE